MSSYIKITTVDSSLLTEGTSIIDIIKWCQSYVDVSEFGTAVWCMESQQDKVYVDPHELSYDAYNTFKDTIDELDSNSPNQDAVIPSNVMIDLWVEGRTLYILHQRLGYFNTKEEWAKFVNKNKFVI